MNNIAGSISGSVAQVIIFTFVQIFFITSCDIKSVFFVYFAVDVFGFGSASLLHCKCFSGLFNLLLTITRRTKKFIHYACLAAH